MSIIEGPIEDISDKRLTIRGNPMVDITIGGVKMGKFFKDDADYEEFRQGISRGSNVKALYSTNGKWKNLESLELLPTTTQTTLLLPEGIDNKMARAAVKKEQMKYIKDSVTGEKWSNDTVIKQLKKDIKNIREMMESMNKLVEVL